MYSKKWKLEKLFSFFMGINRARMGKLCPFGKNLNTMKSSDVIFKVHCSELCGAFKELGSSERGCPCETLGIRGAYNQLEYLLTKEGYLNSKGETI